MAQSVSPAAFVGVIVAAGNCKVMVKRRVDHVLGITGGAHIATVCDFEAPARAACTVSVGDGPDPPIRITDVVASSIELEPLLPLIDRDITTAWARTFDHALVRVRAIAFPGTAGRHRAEFVLGSTPIISGN